MHEQARYYASVPAQGDRTKSLQKETIRRLVSTLKQCSKARNLERGKKLHVHALVTGCHTNKYVAAALINMYTKCTYMHHAQEVLDSSVVRDVVMWNSLLSGYVENGEILLAIDLFTKMDSEPNCFTYVAIVKAYTELAAYRESSIEKAAVLHEQIQNQGYDSDIFIASALVDMYAKYGSMQQAQKVFDKMVIKNVVTWTCLILGYVENGESFIAMELFNKMDCEADCYTYVAVLKACAGLTDLEKGASIHQQVKDRGFDTNVVVASTLVDMYGKCGCMKLAQDVFNSMRYKNVFTWTSLVMGYVENGESSLAMEVFSEMECEPTHVTYVAVLKACANLAVEKESRKHIYLDKGISIHEQLKERGLQNIMVANTLIDMYAKCGSIHHAKDVFDGILHKDVVTWNCLIMGYAENGQSSIAMDLFSKMDCEPTFVTYIAALKACIGMLSNGNINKQSSLEIGISIHRQLKDRVFISNIVVANTLVEMYGKCGSMNHALEVFNTMVTKDLVTWTCLIQGYVDNGESSAALEVFSKIECEPDSFVYISVLKACIGLKDFEKGVYIHKLVRDGGFESDLIVASALMNMYFKCGSMERAREVFDRMIYKDAVTWACIIMGYVDNGESSNALDIYAKMDCEPDCFTYVAVVKACGNVSGLPFGKWIHFNICRLGLVENRLVASALVDLYGKCSCISIAEHIFNSMCSLDIFSWNALLLGYSSLGDSSRVFTLTRSIQEAGLQMDGVTFVSILTACSHGGLVEKGGACFEYMLRYGICPTIEHYNCLVDLLSRSNRMDEALSIVNNMPVKANRVTWTTFLGACKKHRNLRFAKVAFEALVTCNSQEETSAYALMGDIYGSLYNTNK